jgi:hypothetical protein
MLHRVDVVLTDVSEERIASIFRVKGKIRKGYTKRRLTPHLHGATSQKTAFFIFFFVVVSNPKISLI